MNEASGDDASGVWVVWMLGRSLQGMTATDRTLISRAQMPCQADHRPLHAIRFMLPIAIKSSRRKFAVLLLLAIAFVVVGVRMVNDGHPNDQLAGWLGIVFFGAGIPLFAWRILDSRPRLVISDEGVVDCTLGIGLIPWTDIKSAKLMTLRYNHFICLEVRDPAQWTSRMSPLMRAMASTNQAFGFAAINLNLGGIAANPVEVYQLVLKMITESRAGKGLTHGVG